MLRGIFIGKKLKDQVEAYVLKCGQYQINKAKRKLGTAKGMIKIAPDFDEPLEEFEEYMS